MLSSRDQARDRLMFVATGHVRVSTGGKSYDLGVEDTARAIAGADFAIEALDDAMIVQTSAPAQVPTGTQKREL